jgi:hypothetical protein
MNDTEFRCIDSTNEWKTVLKGLGWGGWVEPKYMADSLTLPNWTSWRTAAAAFLGSRAMAGLNSVPGLINEVAAESQRRSAYVEQLPRAVERCQARSFNTSVAASIADLKRSLWPLRCAWGALRPTVERLKNSAEFARKQAETATFVKKSADSKELIPVPVPDSDQEFIDSFKSRYRALYFERQKARDMEEYWKKKVWPAFGLRDWTLDELIVGSAADQAIPPPCPDVNCFVQTNQWKDRLKDRGWSGWNETQLNAAKTFGSWPSAYNDLKQLIQASRGEADRRVRYALNLPIAASGCKQPLLVLKQSLTPLVCTWELLRSRTSRIERLAKQDELRALTTRPTPTDDDPGTIDIFAYKYRTLSLDLEKARAVDSFWKDKIRPTLGLPSWMFNEDVVDRLATLTANFTCPPSNSTIKSGGHIPYNSNSGFRRLLYRLSRPHNQLTF